MVCAPASTQQEKCSRLVASESTAADSMQEGARNKGHGVGGHRRRKLSTRLLVRGSITGASYLEMLQTVMWPSVRTQTTRRGYLFQHDGAPVHVSPEVINFITSKFGDRLFSRRAQQHWPSYTVRIYPAWTSASAAHEVTERALETLGILKTVVEGFARGMDGDHLRRMARHTQRRAELCCAERRGHLEHLL